jgi:hypothetical protein
MPGERSDGKTRVNRRRVRVKQEKRETCDFFIRHFPQALLWAFKAKASLHGKTMKEVGIQLISEWVRKEGL